MSKFERPFVWLGGAAFVAALAVCAWFYAVVWSEARTLDPGRTPRAVAANALLFTLFALHHSVFARPRVKAWLAGLVPDRLLRSVYVWIASALLLVVVFWWQPIGGRLYHHTGLAAIAHSLVQLTGVWLVARSAGIIDALELAGIRHRDSAGGLQIAGPYRLVRHPLYLGWILIVFGAARMTGDRLAFAVISSIYLLVAVPWEERSLERTFGDAYRRYKQQVRWRVLPYVY